MRKLKVLVASLAVMVMLPVGGVFAKFSDVSNAHWAKDVIDKAVEEEIVAGYPDGTFKPDNTVTRAEYAALIYRVANVPKRAGNAFTDTAGTWVQDDVNTLVQHGIIMKSEYGDRFGMDTPITRLEMAKMVGRVFEEMVEVDPANLSFTDTSGLDSTSKKYIAIANHLGIIGGYPDKTFKPNNHLTRAESVKTIMFTLDKVKELKGTAPRESKVKPGREDEYSQKFDESWTNIIIPVKNNNPKIKKDFAENIENLPVQGEFSVDQFGKKISDPSKLLINIDYFSNNIAGVIKTNPFTCTNPKFHDKLTGMAGMVGKKYIGFNCEEFKNLFSLEDNLLFFLIDNGEIINKDLGLHGVFEFYMGVDEYGSDQYKTASHLGMIIDAHKSYDGFKSDKIKSFILVIFDNPFKGM